MILLRAMLAAVTVFCLVVAAVGITQPWLLHATL